MRFDVRNNLLMTSKFILLIRLTVLLILFVAIAHTNSFDLECYFKNWGFDTFPSVVRTCFAIELNITTDDQIVTSLNGESKPNTQVKGLRVDSQELYFIPKGIEKFLPNLRAIQIEHSKLRELRQSDLKPFPLLEEFKAAENELKVLPDDLFINNPEMEKIDFSLNPLTYVDPNIFSRKLKYGELNMSGCINSDHYGGLEQLKEDIRANCSTLPVA